MAVAISTVFELAGTMLDAFLQSRQDTVVDPVETIRKIATHRKLSKKLTDDLVSAYQDEPEPTRFGVINAFTRAAQQLTPLERIEMERFAGSLVNGF